MWAACGLRGVRGSEAASWERAGMFPRACSWLAHQEGPPHRSRDLAGGSAAPPPGAGRALLSSPGAPGLRGPTAPLRERNCQELSLRSFSPSVSQRPPRLTGRAPGRSGRMEDRPWAAVRCTFHAAWPVRVLPEGRGPVAGKRVSLICSPGSGSSPAAALHCDARLGTGPRLASPASADLRQRHLAPREAQSRGSCGEGLVPPGSCSRPQSPSSLDSSRQWLLGSSCFPSRKLDDRGFAIEVKPSLIGCAFR